MSKDTFIFKKGNFSYHILTKEYSNQAVVFLANAFSTEPTTNGLTKSKENMLPNFYDWEKYINYWISHCSTNGFSVIAFEEEKRHMVGVLLARDLHYLPGEEYTQTYSCEGEKLTPWVVLMDDLEEKTEKIKPELHEKGASIEMHLIGVHPDYRGQKITVQLISAAEHLVKEDKTNNYRYSVLETSNYYLQKVARSCEMEEVENLDVKNFLWKGKIYFANVQPPHGHWRYFYKLL